MNAKGLTLCLPILFAPPATAQQADAPSPLTLKVYWENDGAMQDPFDSYDRHYTNGFAIVLEHQPQWADDAQRYLPFDELFEKHHGQAKTGAGYVLSQLIFTPTNLTATAPVTTDQPYAGYLYGGVFVQRQGQYNHRDDVAVLDHFEVNLGLVGPSALGYDIQKWVHDHFEGDDPRGWHNQLADEPTFQAYYRRKWRIDAGSVESALLGDMDVQLIPQAGVALGTVYRQADAAVTVRLGQNLPDDFGPGRINDLQSVTGDKFVNSGWSWYVFGRAGGKAVQHELFLDGSTWDNPSLSVDREPLVGEVQGGLAIGYQPSMNSRFDFTWGITYQTHAFDGPGATGTESYGTFVFSWTGAY